MAARPSPLTVACGPRRLADLDPRARRRAVARTVAVIAVVWAVLVGAYALLTVQMVLDLLVVGVLARLLFAAAREGLASGRRTSDPPPGG